MYYLNVMAGPANPHRPGGPSWLTSDHPDQAWVPDSWAGQDVDPRLRGRR